ncbi:hypothetical protein K8T06_01630 [bacterium]|nr:hypothetical protein [bacterium]
MLGESDDDVFDDQVRGSIRACKPYTGQLLIDGSIDSTISRIKTFMVPRDLKPYSELGIVGYKCLAPSQDDLPCEETQRNWWRSLLEKSEDVYWGAGQDFRIKRFRGNC